MSYLREAKLREIKQLHEAYLLEGGAYGHMRHVHDNPDLTFGEIKDIIRMAASGELEKVTEKTDGQALVFSWSVEHDALRVARSSGDIGRGGMDAAALATKFQGRGNVADAFNGAFKVLTQALGSLPENVKLEVFGSTASMWYSIEVIYPENANVINYDSNYLIFHTNPVFEIGVDGKISRTTEAPGVELLSKHIDAMQKAVMQRSWRVRAPDIISMKKLSDGSIVQKAIARISKAQSEAGLDDSATMGDFIRSMMSEEVADLGLSPKAAAAVVARASAEAGAPSLVDIKKMVPKEAYAGVNQFVKAGPAVMKKIVQPIEHAIHSFTLEVLRGFRSSWVGNHDEEVVRLRSDVEKAIKSIEASGNVQAMEVLSNQLQKLGSIDDITSSSEGIVFFYKGNAYKMTGNFAPVNQILGLFKYGRGSQKISAQENYLREAVENLIRNGLR